MEASVECLAKLLFLHIRHQAMGRVTNLRQLNIGHGRRCGRWQNRDLKQHKDKGYDKFGSNHQFGSDEQGMLKM